MPAVSERGRSGRTAPESDVIVIGSGPAGVHALAPLLDAGLSVTLLEIGRSPEAERHPEPDTDFLTLRRECRDQWRWFLGDDTSGIGSPPARSRSATSGDDGLSWLVQGRRSYVIGDAARLLPTRTEHLRLLQAVSRGGLAAAWGGACTLFSDEELRACGIPARAIQSHLEAIVDEIGVSGPPGFPGVEPPPESDHHSALLLDRARHQARRLAALGVELHRSHLALITGRDRGERRIAAATDLHHYADPRRSVYRPQYTLERLRGHERLRVCSGRVVTAFRESTECVEVDAQLVESGGERGRETYRARAAILAAGAAGSARIALASLGRGGEELPFLVKDHDLIACLHPACLGVPGSDKRFGLCQLVLRGRLDGDGGLPWHAQLYAYRSFLLFRLLESVPLPLPEALRALSILTPALIIADLRHPATPPRAGALRHTGSGLRIVCAARSTEPSERAALHQTRRALRSLGLWPISRRSPGHGSTSHYGGTLPASPRDRPFTVDEQGRLRPCARVFVADSSVFAALPAGSPTLTIMANARRVACGLAEQLREEHLELATAPEREAPSSSRSSPPPDVRSTMGDLGKGLA